MPYQINQHKINDSIISLLDHTDLGDIGYKKFRTCNSKPMLSTRGQKIYGPTYRALPRPTPSPPWHFDGTTVVIPDNNVSSSMKELDPVYYPLPHDHEASDIEFPDPLTFQPGNLPYTYPLLNPYFTLEDMITVAVQHSPATDPIITLMTFYNFLRKDLETRFMKLPFINFLQQRELPPDQTNGICTYNSHQDGYGTGDRYLIHKSWLPLNRHPSIKQLNAEKVIYRRQHIQQTDAGPQQ